METRGYLRAVRLLRDEVAAFDRYPFSIPAVRGLEELALDPKVTFLIGDNGSGKSTLIEAIAVLAGFNAEGGSRNFSFSTRRSESELHRFMRPVRGIARLGHEVLAPYATPDADGLPLHQLPGRQGQPLPYLGYAPGAYLGRVTELILKEAAEAVHRERVYETDMAEGLKAMALEGHGIAFLPHSAVEKDLRARKLVDPGSGEFAGLQIAMELRAYRARPSGKQPAKGTAQALWSFLAEAAREGAPPRA